jgi:hypothetical protein
MTGYAVQAILRYCFIDLKGFGVGVTVERDL